MEDDFGFFIPNIEIPLNSEDDTFKKNIAIPYFKDIFKDLKKRSEKGVVNKYVFLKVRLSLFNNKVCRITRNHWRKTVRSNCRPRKGIN
jgi:predicted ATP-dependent Lon-type protease